MADPLYLSLWFSHFTQSDMMPRLLSVVRQLMFSGLRPGISAVAVHPVSWSEPTILERRFRPGIDPEQAIAIVGDMLHPDYAYLVEGYWDLWVPSEETGEWVVEPRPVKFIAHSLDFDDGAYQESGHIQVDFGLDTPFLFDDVELNDTTEPRVRANVQKLVNFTNAVEKNCGIGGRVLWSESEENLAQKLISRLQKTH
ncbi:MAG: hypothetical protein LAO06_18150 [Acidobacteriia bacterium]|nr:hypothetical protein [Terriglobia bacterium]